MNPTYCYWQKEATAQTSTYGDEFLAAFRYSIYGAYLYYLQNTISNLVASLMHKSACVKLLCKFMQSYVSDTL